MHVDSLVCFACASGSGGVMSGVGGLWVGLWAAGGWRLLSPPSIVSSCLPV